MLNTSEASVVILGSITCYERFKKINFQAYTAHPKVILQTPIIFQQDLQHFKSLFLVLHQTLNISEIHVSDIGIFYWLQSNFSYSLVITQPLLRAIFNPETGVYLSSGALVFWKNQAHVDGVVLECKPAQKSALNEYLQLFKKVYIRRSGAFIAWTRTCPYRSCHRFTTQPCKAACLNAVQSNQLYSNYGMTTFFEPVKKEEMLVTANLLAAEKINTISDSQLTTSRPALVSQLWEIVLSDTSAYLSFENQLDTPPELKKCMNLSTTSYGLVPKTHKTESDFSKHISALAQDSRVATETFTANNIAAYNTEFAYGVSNDQELEYICKLKQQNKLSNLAEIYFGIYDENVPAHVSKTPHRRPHRQISVNSATLDTLVASATSFSRCSLAFNELYTVTSLRYILTRISEYTKYSYLAYIFSDLNLLWLTRDLNSFRTSGVGLGVYNAEAVRFAFEVLQVDRLVLSRKLYLTEYLELLSEFPAQFFELFTNTHHGCPNLDSACFWFCCRDLHTVYPFFSSRNFLGPILRPCSQRATVLATQLPQCRACIFLLYLYLKYLPNSTANSGSTTKITWKFSSRGLKTTSNLNLFFDDSYMLALALQKWKYATNCQHCPNQIPKSIINHLYANLKIKDLSVQSLQQLHNS